MNLADSELILGSRVGARVRAHRRSRGGRRHPAQHLRDPRARRGARRRPPYRSRAPESASPGSGARHVRLHGAAPSRGIGGARSRRSISSSARTRIAACRCSSTRRGSHAPPGRRAATARGHRVRRAPEQGSTRSSTCVSTPTRPTPISTPRAPRARCARGSRSCAAATSSAPSASCRTCADASAACRPTRCSREVRDAAAAGAREVVFLGQTVNAYRDGELTTSRRCCAAPRRARHRAHPLHLAASRRHESRPRCDAMRDVPAVAPQLHLPVQSGSDAVLGAHGARLHGRRSTAISSRGCATRFPTSRSRPTSSSGFPDESPADFDATVRAPRGDRATIRRSSSSTRRARSPRAATWDDSVPDDEKSRRLVARDRAAGSDQRPSATAGGSDARSRSSSKDRRVGRRDTSRARRRSS